MSKKLDRDIKALGLMLRGCKASSPEMLQANLLFVCRKYFRFARIEDRRATPTKPDAGEGKP